MKRRSRNYCLLLAVALASATQAWAQTPALTTGQIHDFLLTAEVIAAEQTEKGTTKPWRLTLSDGTLTHDAPSSRSTETRARAGSVIGTNGTSSTPIATTAPPTCSPNSWVSAT